MIERVDHPQSLQTAHPELFSTFRRNINSLKQKDTLSRKNAISQLLNIIIKQQMLQQYLDQITQMCLKQCLKCFADVSQVCRQNSVKIVIQLMGRCKKLGAYLPYVFSVLIDRSNCYDLQNIANIPQKMRPPPGQKPKVLLKLIQPCEEVRALYCQVVLKIITFAQQNQIRRHLDDIVNILRALIMDPSPQIQKTACNTLEYLCKSYKQLLLHYTEIMGRAVLLPLIAKKSKIRIAGLNALTAIFWCGLWKYNAFVFQNLIGFRDPNSVPIKDFYQPSHNINYLATFIIDPNAKVRQQFMRHLHIWICKLDDKYDHHGKLVPYLMSGLFDSDELVRDLAMQAIAEIGKQIQIERQKDFRDNKQFAIDSAWTWQGKLVDLPLLSPLKSRPSLGSRFFIRGHVRKMWPALYKQIKQLNVENRSRATNLLVFNIIFTQNYLTQFLDKLIPQLLPCLLPLQPGEQVFCKKIEIAFRYIGRYCEQSSYLHIIKSVLRGQIVQNQNFVRSGIKALGALISGSLQAIPQDQSLCHKKNEIIQLLTMLNDCDLVGNIYQANCIQGKKISIEIIVKLKEKASRQQLNQIMTTHFLTLLKLLSTCYYSQSYSASFAVQKLTNKNSIEKQTIKQGLIQHMDILLELFPSYPSILDDYLTQLYQNPPSLVDQDWKLLIVLHNYLALKDEGHKQTFNIIQDVIGQSILYNRSIEILTFTTNYIKYLIQEHQIADDKSKIIHTYEILYECLHNLVKFKSIKKVPIYDQVEDKDPDKLKMSQQTYVNLFQSISFAFQTYYIQRLQLKQEQLAKILKKYFQCFETVKKNKICVKQSIKTIWVIFQRSEKLNLKFPQLLLNETKQPMIPKIIDFLIERLETMVDNTDVSKVTMIFSVLNSFLKFWPKTTQVTDKLLYIYPEFPQLYEKLFKYALNEKDIETKDRYYGLLVGLCEKMPSWFEYEANLAQKSKKYEKQKLIKDIIRKARF